MHMADHQGLDMLDREIDGEPVGPGAGAGGFRTLEQAVAG